MPQSMADMMDSATPSSVPASQNTLCRNVVEQLVGNASYWSIIFTIFILCVTYDQAKYLWNKRGIAGPAFKLPFMGPFLESINPKFEEYHAKWLSGPLSCVSVFHKFVVIASTRDLARKVLNSPMYVKPCVVDVAKKLLGPTNWVFLDGKAHVDYRKGLNNLFTRSALSQYLPAQEALYDKHFTRWLGLSKENPGMAFMGEFREINCAISCRIFCGTYLEEEKVKKISDDYYRITAALELVNFPFIVPYTKTWYGKKCADMVLDEFSKCAQKSKDAIAAGAEPHCLLDHWVKIMFEARDRAEAEKKGQAAETASSRPMNIRIFSNYEIAQTLFTFLFASQDASSSCTTWMFQILADRPEIYEKVRAEQLAVRGGDVNKRITMDMVEQMTYTRAVIKETLRYRPPVLMVPYEVKKNFPVTEHYTIPKGSMVVPTLWPALHDPEAYHNPDEFNPDRWLEGGEAEKAVKNWLVFGTGPHYCIAQTYAIQNFMCMLGKATMTMKWKHHVTPRSEEIKVFATIFPMDDCKLTFERRSDIP